MGNTLVFIIFVHFCLNCLPIQASLLFDNLKCRADQTEMIVMQECRIQAVNRTFNVINFRYKLKKILPEVNVKFLKLERGTWRPFLYKMTLDVCDFMQRPKRYLVPNIIFKHLRRFTNINHTCPYLANKELQVLGWFLDEKSIINLFPVDPGEYALHTIWYYKQKSLLQINCTAMYTE